MRLVLQRVDVGNIVDYDVKYESGHRALRFKIEADNLKSVVCLLKPISNKFKRAVDLEG